MPVNSKAQVSLLSAAKDKWPDVNGKENKIVTAFREFSTGDGVNVNTQNEMADLVTKHWDELQAAVAIEWSLYKKAHGIK